MREEQTRGPVPTDDAAGDAKDIAEGNDEAAVEWCGVIRAIP